ncbi:ABC transporter ATP-binding protein [Streptomyces sp. JJ36]|uniref:ABC transporter ATP-binding protein n=1 Tax=Streptomyces sp. JJ36 TaxID=2736645 RepID=UPI001F3FF092|nr:ABC transporter ATP-binding protein [Streptomyces sp. JJ36]MCF6522298.1 ABC transporter ATP-binding protein [Streptomyces sp. JJ36]
MASPPPAEHAEEAPRRNAHRLLAGAARDGAAGTAGVLLAGLAESAVALALPAVLGRALDRLLAGAGPADPWIAACAALFAAQMLLGAAVAVLNGTVTARGTAWLRRRGTGHLLAAGPRATDRFTPGDLVTRLGQNAADAGTAPASAATAVTAVVTPLGGLLALAAVDLWLAAVFLGGTPLLAALLRTFARGSSASVTDYQHTQGRIATALTEALGGARTVAAAGTADRERRRVLEPLAELDAQGRRMWQVYGRAMVGSGVLAPLLATAVLAAGGLRLAAGALSVGELLAASRYAFLAVGVGTLVGRVDALVRGRAAASRIAGLLTVPAVPYGTWPLPAGGPGRLELHRVTVRRGGTAVLRDVDLVVPGGSTMAVVGRSGAGKSLLAAVAGRLTDPDHGRVLLDGVPLTEADPAVLRREVAYAFERPALFGRTVAAAVGFGPRDLPRTRVEAAARAAGADTFVRLLPDGYDTPLREAPLSGGEAQRLGLARAFAHAGRLLVLDDATSSLDSATEREVGRALLREVRPGTRLLVAHRASSAARADLVTWLENGRVRAVGRHHELWHDPDYRAVFAPDEDLPPGAGTHDGGPPDGDGDPERAGAPERAPARSGTDGAADGGDTASPGPTGGGTAGPSARRAGKPAPPPGAGTPTGGAA